MTLQVRCCLSKRICLSTCLSSRKIASDRANRLSYHVISRQNTQAKIQHIQQLKHRHCQAHETRHVRRRSSGQSAERSGSAALPRSKAEGGPLGRPGPASCSHRCPRLQAETMSPEALAALALLLTGRAAWQVCSSVTLRMERRVMPASILTSVCPAFFGAMGCKARAR